MGTRQAVENLTALEARECATVPPSPPTISGQKADLMARKRFQSGSIELRSGSWTLRVREDLNLDNGQQKRESKRYAFAPAGAYASKRAAKRDPFVVQKLAELNAVSYRGYRVMQFSVFAEKWKKEVLSQHRPSTQAGDTSRIDVHLTRFFGETFVKDISPEQVQRFVSSSKLSPKSVRNCIALLREMFSTAKAWRCTTQDWFEGLALPEVRQAEQPVFSAEQAKRIIEAAQEPYATIFALAAETGIRRGELCALRVCDIDLVGCAVIVRRSVWGNETTPTKSKRPRVLALSPSLAKRLEPFCADKQPDGLLFLAGSRAINPDVLVADYLKPILDKLKLSGGMHAFRHGVATEMDRMNTPMAVRQGRLGHAESKTTMGYTHMVTDDDRRTALQISERLM